MSLLKLDVVDKIATLTIESPPANALSVNLLESLNEQFDYLSENENVKAVILKGEGRFFSAGADIKEFTSLQTADDTSALAKRGQSVFKKIEDYPVPVIASIHGAALGGGLELALSCHVRIVTKSALLGLPETTLGIIPGFAGTQRLPNVVGQAKATEMMLTGEPITGEEALKHGLANHVVEDEELEEVTNKLAKKISEKSKLTINYVMELINYSTRENFGEGVAKEAELFGKVFQTEDAKEGVEAFIEKRKPDFQDK